MLAVGSFPFMGLTFLSTLFSTKKKMRKFVGGKPRPIAAETYKKFAKRYKIKFEGSLSRMAQKIYDFEKKEGTQKGLYFQPKNKKTRS